MREMEALLETDNELADAYRKAHLDYLRDRERDGVVDEISGVSAGGMPKRVKCLHVLVAHALACGNPVGDIVYARLRPWWIGGPCVESA